MALKELKVDNTEKFEKDCFLLKWLVPEFWKN